MASARGAEQREDVDLVDEEDRVIGRAAREDASRSGAGFRVVHAFLFDDEGRLLVHELASQKRLAGHWGSSAAGAVRSGESPDAAAAREVREELGLVAPRLRFVGKVRLQDGGATKFLYLYEGRVENPSALHPDEREVARLEFLPLHVVRDLVRSRERRFTPTFLSAFALYERGAVA